MFDNVFKYLLFNNQILNNKNDRLRIIYLILIITTSLINICIANESPKIAYIPPQKGRLEGSTVALTCVCEHGTQPVKIYWHKDGKMINPDLDSDIKVDTKEMLSILYINKVQSKHNGNYTCTAHNSFGDDSITVPLTVNVPPKFIMAPDDQSIGIGQSLEITCRAEGSPIASITWNKIAYHNSDGYPMKTYINSGEILKLINIRNEDAGLYECVAKNPLNGLIVNKTFQINVFAPAQFLEKSSQLTVRGGNKVKLVCEAIGARPLNIQWFKRDNVGNQRPLLISGLSSSPTIGVSQSQSFTSSSEIDSSAISRYTIFEKDFLSDRNETTFELHINSVQLTDSGIYECLASNQYGKAVRTIELIVQDIPSAPLNLVLGELKSRSISLQWSQPLNNGNSDILQYIIQYWRNNKENGTSHRLFERSFDGRQTSITINDQFSPGTSYTLRVLAKNEFGRSLPSEEINFITNEEKPDSSPIDISIESKGSTALRIKWKAPPKNHWNGQLKGYIIEYILQDERNEGPLDNNLYTMNIDNNNNNVFPSHQSYSNVPFIGSSIDNYYQEYTLIGLKKASSYRIVIWAYNEAGKGPKSQPYFATTSDNDPPPPPIIWVGEVNEHKLTIKWDQKGNLEDITHYAIFYKDDKSPWIELAFPANSGNQYELDNLEPNSYYQIYMKCMSKRGSSDSSEVITVKTFGNSKNFLEASVDRIANRNDQLTQYVIIPITVAIVIIVTVCAIAYVHVKHEERKVLQLRMSSPGVSPSSSKTFHPLKGSLTSMSTVPSRCQSIVSEEGTLTLRYTDHSDRSKPLLARPPVPTVLWAQQQGPIMEENEDFPSPYATLPLQRLTTFNSPPNMKPPPPPSFPSTSSPPPSTSGFDARRHSHGSFLQQQHSHVLIPPPPVLPGNNISCKADIHYDEENDGSDVYDFFKPNVV